MQKDKVSCIITYVLSI